MCDRRVFGRDGLHLLGLSRPSRAVCAAIRTVVYEHPDSRRVYRGGGRRAAGWDVVFEAADEVACCLWAVCDGGRCPGGMYAAPTTIENGRMRSAERRGRQPLRRRGGFHIRPGCLRLRKMDAERLPVYSAGL